MAEADTNMDSGAQNAAQMEKRRRWLTWLGLAVLVALLLWALWYFIYGRNSVSTDNAYVNAEVAQVTPQISGQAIAVHVRDTQAVKRGDVLVELDPVNARIALAQAEADMAQARRHFRQAEANDVALGAQVDARDSDISSARSRLTAARADYAKAASDLQHRQALASSGAVSGDELTAARRATADAQAMLDTARAGVSQARATRASAEGQMAANHALIAGSSELSDPAVLAASALIPTAVFWLPKL